MSQEPSDWLQIAITLKSKCVVCGNDVLPGRAFWSKSSKAFRHLACIATTNAPDTVLGTQEKPGDEPGDNSVEAQIHDKRLEDLLCFLCGAKTSCSECSLLQDCTARLESKYCICESCAYRRSDMTGTYQEYQQAFLKLMDSQNK